MKMKHLPLLYPRINKIISNTKQNIRQNSITFFCAKTMDQYQQHHLPLSTGFYQNLLENKVPDDHQPLLQVISFCTNQAGSCWVVELSDGGCSFIARGISESLYERFSRGSFAQRNGIIRLLEWRRATTRGGNHCLLLLDFCVVASSSPLIGNSRPTIRRSPSPLAIQPGYPDDFFDGHLKLKLEKVSELGVGQKFAHNAVVGQFKWELVAVKRMVFGEERAPSLVIGLYCGEQDKRVDGWNCAVRVKLDFSGERCTSRAHFFDVTYPSTPVELPLPWDKLVKDYLGDNDFLEISAKLTIVEQTGYGTLVPLDTVLSVNGNSLHVNKYHLALYSSYFRALFFSKSWGNAANAQQQDQSHYSINDPLDDVEAFRMMLAIANPVDNHTNNNKMMDNKIDAILRLSDKYDMGIVTERCEKHLMSVSEKPLLQKLALAEHYNLLNLRSYCLEKVSPAHFCIELRQNISLYNELSEGLKAKLDETMARMSRDRLLMESGLPAYKKARFELSNSNNEGGRPVAFRFK